MFCGIRCLTWPRFRPVRLPGWYPGEDVQGSIPAGWCVRCGGELFARGVEVCDRCRGKEYYDDERECESLSGV